MTLSLTAIFALAVEERVNARVGAILLWPSLAIGLFSLLEAYPVVPGSPI